MRDKLTALAFGGGKVVTSDLLANYQIEGEPVEQPGDISILLDSDERPVAMIEDVRSTVIRLADMTDEDAIDEGEGYADAAAFRVSHEDHWSAFIDEVRDGLGDPTFTITDDTPIVVERFRIAAIVGTMGRRSSRASAPPTRPIGRPSTPSLRNTTPTWSRGAASSVDARTLPALIVKSGGVIEGVLTWALDGAAMEVLTLHATQQWEGIGSALLAAARRVAEASGVRRIWLITTNDNVDALRFYQRRGFQMIRLGAGAVDRSRATLKQAIPEVGAHGIPLRDELVLELQLDDVPAPSLAVDAPTLLALELALARRDEAAIPGGYEAVLAPDFLEIGSSGRLWTRAEILAALHAEPPNASISIEAFEIADLGPDLILASYDSLGITSDGEARQGRRSSIWVRQDDHWQLRFHQGTPISFDEDDGAR